MSLFGKRAVTIGTAVMLSVSCLCGCADAGNIAAVDPALLEQYTQDNPDVITDDKAEDTDIEQPETKEPETEDTGSEEPVMPELVNEEFNISEYDEEDGYTVFESHRNSFFCDDASKELFPKLAVVLESIDEAEEDSHRYTMESCLDEAREFAKESFDNGEDWHYMAYSESALQFADDNVTSILRTEYGYLGGAHPDYYFECININSQTGEEILLSEIINDKDGLNEVLKDKLNEDYPDGDFFDLDESLACYDLDGVPEGDEITPYIFTLTPAGITFYFDPYSLNSYADGDQQVDIFFSDIPELLQDDYIFADYEEEGRGDLIEEDE
ncbi:MAG: DUF3298 and DUF4163 domain-containing protein [Lachnospiraceae bacterium]|nr:DUF3298 and DUF4163 domain-containing protein [Lachnospiraceae bacterium]